MAFCWSLVAQCNITAPVGANKEGGESKLSCSAPIGDAGSFSLCVSAASGQRNKEDVTRSSKKQTLLTKMQQRCYSGGVVSFFYRSH